MDEKLMKTRVMDMTGEELVALIKEANEGSSSDNVRVRGDANLGDSHLLRGYKELAAYLKCSVPTACRMVSRGDIRTPAIIRSEKTLLFDSELVLQQLTELDSKWLTKQNGKDISTATRHIV